MPEDFEQDGLVNDDPGVTGDDGDDLLSVVSLEGDEGDGEERGTDKGKKEPTSVKDMDPEVLAAHLARAQEHINNLNKALHEERQAKKKAAEKSGEPAFTKAQLKELWTEHRDDPDVLFNILSYMADETARSAQAKAVDQVELVNKKKEVDDYLAQNFPDLANDSSPLRAGVDEAKQELMLTDHPFGDILALGLNNLLNLPQTVKAAYEMGKKEAQGGVKPMDRRREKINAGNLPKGKTPKVDAEGMGSEIQSPEIMDVAKRIGLSKQGQQIYAKILKNSKTRSVTVEG